METPSALIRAFLGALKAEDLKQLEEHCTARGWSERGESIGRFIQQIQRDRLEFIPLGELVEDGQRAAICGLLTGAQPARHVGRIWLHALKTDTWRFEGFSKLDAGSALFVSGIISAIFKPEALPQSEHALRWGEEALEALKHGQETPRGFTDALKRFPEATWAQLKPYAAHVIGATGRHALGLGQCRHDDEIGRKIWLALEEDEGAGLRLIGHRNGASEALLMKHHQMTSSPTQR